MSRLEGGRAIDLWPVMCLPKVPVSDWDRYLEMITLGTRLVSSVEEYRPCGDTEYKQGSTLIFGRAKGVEEVGVTR